MALKDRRTKILISLALTRSTSENPLIYSDHVCSIYDITMNASTHRTLTFLIEDNLVIKSSNDNSYYLTDSGMSEVALSFPFFRTTISDWDGYFRILSYEIPEKKRELRDRLRRQVSMWGLGPWHRSFWITPHPIIPDLRRLIGSAVEEKFVQAFESSHVFGDRDLLVEKVWGKRELESSYRSLFKTWHDTLSQSIDNSSKMKIVADSYIDILKRDPGLPKELVGAQWIGFEAMTLFTEIHNILVPQTKS